jgi:chaperonin cofactor prefoldin
MAAQNPNSFLVRARKSEIARLRKKKGEVEKRIADMRSSTVMFDEQIAEHEAEIKKLGGAP